MFMKINGRLCCSIAVLSMAFIQMERLDAGMAQTDTLNIQPTASSSPFYGQINKTQSAEMLERMINEGQDRAVMLKYLGVDPRIIAQVQADQITLKFKIFDQYSQRPVHWTRLGSLMSDFNAKWKDVSEISASQITEEDGLSYWYLQLSTDRNQSTTLIPLTEQPGGYTIADTLLAVSILTGRIKPSETQEKSAPRPASEPAMEPAADPVSTEAAPAPIASAPPALEDTGKPASDILPTPTRPIQALPTPQPLSETDLRRKLEMLKQLHDDGLIDTEIFKQKQREILDRL